jgi:hypothetical protein
MASINVGTSASIDHMEQPLVEFRIEIRIAFGRDRVRRQLVRQFGASATA